MRGRWLIAGLIVLAVAVGCEGIRDWDEKDRTLWYTYNALSAVDGVVSIAGMDNYEERNVLMQDSAGRPSPVKVIAVKVGVSALMYFVLDRYPDIRTEVLIGINGLQGAVLLWNISQW